MTGDEHYEKAERLVYYASNDSTNSPQERLALAAETQVHATLALAAATARAAKLLGYGR